MIKFINFIPMVLRHQENIQREICTNISPLYFKITNTLLGEPLKKKKKLDPAIVRARVERRKKKVEKEIRRLEKLSKQLKPIDEIEIPSELINMKEKRLRRPLILKEEEIDNRIHAIKNWNKYKIKQHLNDLRIIELLLFSQQNALNEVKVESEQLYNEAIQPAFTLTPYIAQGPTNTPFLESYDNPDGDYTDITKKYEGEE
ncbi:large ribosomal subunit protein mL40-like isoform X1 [Prorops nasuta]|uniref:large ribosomal subunit protein mL40-like isoform X1 n=1 Tax=Prorops nasuta TaxID=863751 RepID=UPI0034CDF0DC